MEEHPPPSSWARERFGEMAEQLRHAVPAALQEAHRRALSAHLGGQLKTNEAYGTPLAVIQHEELVQQLYQIDGARTMKPPGGRYELIVINHVVLYPWRYAADAKTSLEDAPLRRPISDVRKDLFALATLEPDGQLTLDDAEIDDADLKAEWEADRAALHQLAKYARVVVVAYASNPKAGLLHASWGDAELTDEDRGLLTWHYREPLPLAGPTDPGSGGLWRPHSPPSPASPQSQGRRFDDGPLPEPELGPQSPLTEPTSEPPSPSPETGSDERQR